MRRLAALSLVLAAAAPAAAQEAQHDVVVLSVGGDAPEDAAREVRQAVAAALEADGLRVLPEAELALRVPPGRLHGCDSIACAFRLGRELGVPMVAAVATWQGEAGPSSITVSLVVSEERGHAATEEVGERGVARAAAAAVRGAQDARARALVIEGSTGAAGDSDQDDDAGVGDTNAPVVEEAPAPRERSLEEYVLPAILGVVGLALVAGAVYALLPEQCELRAPSGLCLRGNGPNVGLGTVLAVTGGLSVAGAIVWMIVGGLPEPMGPIDVVLGPHGGGVGWRGTF